jgi:hypothetical protein
MDCTWPVDTSCCADFATYPQEVQDRAVALAGMTLQTLTAYRVGACPITVRPCRQPCDGYAGSFNWYGYGGGFTPLNWNGTWFNCWCGQDECGCGSLCQITLPPPVGRVDEVKVDGQVLPASAYRVDNAAHLVRVDGQCWPDCQDLSKPDTEVGTFAVTYLNAVPLGALGEYAAGLLACEFAKACSGNAKCRLPTGVTQITRQGVSMDLAVGAFAGGVTGIREVDAYIQSVNPYALKTAPLVWTPDVPKVRVITTPPAAGPPPTAPTYSVTLQDDPYRDDGWAGMGNQTSLLVSQVTPTPGVATDAEIASVNFGDGSPVLTAPYSRVVGTGAIRHTYQAFGEFTYTITYTNPTATSSTGLVKVSPSYSVTELPFNSEVTVGVEPYQIAPWDAYEAAPLPPNEHFATIDWKDGTTGTNPFVVNAQGFVEHIYNTPGTYSPRAVTFSGYPLGGSVEAVPNLTPVYAATEMTEYPVVDFEDAAGLLIEQVTPTPGQATDAEIASITWEPGVVQSPPFTRDVLGRILHTYTAFGPKNWQVDFTAPGATPVTGTVHATYYYYIGWLPTNGIINPGGTLAVRPLDNWQGNPLPPDQHFKAIDWRDGSPIQHPPFTVDGNGYATHVYNTVGNYSIQIGFVDNSTTSLGLQVKAAPPTYAVTEKAPNPANPPVPWLPVQVLKVDQVTPTPGPATDAEIASITWGDGRTQTAPYAKLQGHITHTYEVHGTVHPDGSVDELPWTVDFVEPTAANATGTYPVLIDYYMQANPSTWAILVGGTFGFKPIDGYQGPALPPDSHYKSIDWADGSPVQHPPYTVDGGGFATHVYATAGQDYLILIEYFNGQLSSGSLDVTVSVFETQEELDAHVAALDPDAHKQSPREGAE